MTESNTQVRLAKRPVGKATRENWEIVQEPIPTPANNQLLLKTIYVSLDPAMRGWMNDSASYIEPVAINDVMRAGTISEVITSNHDDFAAGDFVVGINGVQQYALSNGENLQKIDPRLAPLPRYLNTLGMPGMTAYFGLLDTGKPQEGETVVISGAAGAVGAVVGQIAKIKGCRVVGIAGGKEKCEYLINECGYDAAVDYREGNLAVALKNACPKGVDVFFDNVGGEILDTVLTQINFKARIVICGAISQYNNTQPIKGPSNYLSLLIKRARMEGIIVFDNAKSYGKAAIEMAGWMQQGKLKGKEHIVKGIEKFPETLNMLFESKNFGKLVLQVNDDPTQ
ncbi:MAG: NADP-dependent oxidoreductase [Pseudomonadota bacterium]